MNIYREDWGENMECSGVDVRESSFFVHDSDADWRRCRVGVSAYFLSAKKKTLMWTWQMCVAPESHNNAVGVIANVVANFMYHLQK